MKGRTIWVALVVGALAVAAMTAGAASSAPTKRAANNLTVWLQVDAQSGWPDAVAAANQQFKNDHPGWNVTVQYQSWPDHLQKFDATLAANTAPDVIEMGNTEMTKYMAAGAFADLTSKKSSFANSSSWLKGLAASGTFNGKTLRRPVLRRLARRHLPHRSLQEGGHQEDSGEPRRVHGRRAQARGEEQGQELLARVHRRHRLVRRDGLRLRLRRADRGAEARSVGRHARTARLR